jgi:hypothetical protein
VLRIRRPHGKAHAAIDQVRAKQPMSAAMLAHIKEIEIEVGNRAQLGRVRRRPTLFSLSFLGR